MNQPICPMPWSGFYVVQKGEILPCCHVKNFNDEDRCTMQDHGVKGYEQSKAILELKDSIIQGKMHEKYCATCIDQEKNNIKSMRLYEYEQLLEAKPDWNIKDGYVKAQFIFDNTCNLKCIMCSSFFSSKWRKEYSDIYGIDHKSSSVSSKAVKDFFKKNAHTLRIIQLSGGEAFMSVLGLDSSFLDDIIDTGASSNIALYIETNGTIFPEPWLIEKLESFKSVKFNISMDGIGARSEYIRFPSIWTDHSNNLNKFKQLVEQKNKFSMGIMHTLNVFNVLYLKEFLDYFKDFPTKPHIKHVESPHHWSPRVLPAGLKKTIANKLIHSRNLECMRWGKWLTECEYNNHWDDFLLYKDKHDLYRGTNFAKTFPELEELINGF